MEHAQFDSVRVPSAQDVATVIDASVREGLQFFVIYDKAVAARVAEALSMLKASWKAAAGSVRDVDGVRARQPGGFWDQFYGAAPGARTVGALRDVLANDPCAGSPAPALWLWSEAHYLRQGDPVFFGHALPALSEGLSRVTASSYYGYMRRQPPPLSAGLAVSYEWSPKISPGGPTRDLAVRELFGHPMPDFLATLPLRIVHLRE